MFHLEKNKPSASQLCVAPVNSPDNLSSIRALLNLVSSCSGPNAGIHIVRNTCGGHMTMTSDSGRLFASLSLSRQILKLIVSSVQSHLREYGDGGKFMAFACLSLIKSTVQLFGEFTNLRAFCALNEEFVKIISKYLNSEECVVSVNADLTNVHVLLAFTKSILSTRPLLTLAESDQNKVSELIVKCFLESIPESIPGQELGDSLISCHSDNVFVVGSPFEHPRDSRLLKGLLLEHTELPCVNGELKLNIITSNIGGKNGDESEDSVNKYVKVVLVTCSMSGDLEDITSATYEVTEQQALSVENMVLDKWADFCKKLKLCHIGLLLCQKVIHPRLKILLKSCNVMAVDRLGSAAIPYIRDLTGAQPIVSVIADHNLEGLAGNITSAQHVILNDKSYLHLEQPTSALVTLILCSRTEESLEEFKCCVKTSLKGLHSLPKDGKLLCGGGCWQVHCSYKLDEEVRKHLGSLSDAAGCSQAQVLSALSVFRSSVFHHWVRQLSKGQRDVGDCWDLLTVDPASKHCWRTPNFTPIAGSKAKQVLCCCGLKMSVPVSAQGDFHHFHSFITLNQDLDSLVKGPSSNNENKGTCDQTHSKTAGIKDVSKCPESSQWPLDQPVTINTILDNFSCATQGLYKAVFTANLVLSLGQVISDAN